MISVETLTGLGLLKQEAGYLATSGDVGISSNGQKFLTIAGGLLDLFETLAEVHNAAQAAHKAATGGYYVAPATPVAATDIAPATVAAVAIEAPAPAAPPVAIPAVVSAGIPALIAPVAPPAPVVEAPAPAPATLEIDPSNPAYAAIQALLAGGVHVVKN